jgi:hypothetical protein
MPPRNLDDALATLRTLSNEIIDSYLSTSCPCAFPRYRFLVGFNGGTYSEALLHTFDTNVFVSSSVDQDKGFLIPKEDDMYACRVCGSTYRYSYEQYSITFERISLSAVSLAQTDLGAAAEMPFPMIGGVYFVNGAWDEERNDQELVRLSKMFPIVDMDDFRAYMHELAA